jgi:hypothetical protein
MPVNYELSKIYKLESPSGLIYIGSTCEITLARRLASHKRNYKCYLSGKVKFITSFKLFEEDADNVNILLVESFPCNSNDELHAREGHWIKQYDCVNKRIEGRTKKQYCEDNKQQILQQMKQYYENNKETISQNLKQYYEDNKEQILQRKKQYYQRIKQVKLNIKKELDELDKLEKEFEML